MGNYEEEKVRGGMDRRSFFKLGGLTAGMAAFAGMAGCAPQQEMADTGGDNETVAARVPYSVFETDILIIGAGFGASYAVDAARKAGKNVIMVDKGPYGYSGAFGMSFDIMHTWDPNSPTYKSEDDIPNSGFLRDESLYLSLIHISEPTRH